MTMQNTVRLTMWRALADSCARNSDLTNRLFAPSQSNPDFRTRNRRRRRSAARPNATQAPGNSYVAVLTTDSNFFLRI
jgi:hypothetical protein